MEAVMGCFPQSQIHSFQPSLKELVGILKPCGRKMLTNSNEQDEAEWHEAKA